MPAGRRLVCPHGRLHLATQAATEHGHMQVSRPTRCRRSSRSHAAAHFTFAFSNPLPRLSLSLSLSLSLRSSDSLPSPHPPPPPRWWSHPGRGGCCRASRRGGPPRCDGIPRAPRQAAPRWGRYGLRDGHAVAEADPVQQVRPRAEVHDGVHPGLVLIHGTHLSFPQGSVSLSSPIP